MPVETMCEEEWRVIPGYEEFQISNMARVRRMQAPKTSTTAARWGPYPRYLQPSLNGNRHHLTLSSENGKWQGDLSTMVAIAFLPPRPEGYQISHINGDALDSRASNLEWATMASLRVKGIQNNKNGYYVDDAKALSIYEDIKGGMSTRKAADKYEIATTTVLSIVHGRTHKWLGLNPISPEPVRSKLFGLVDEIFELRGKGWTLKMLAEKYGVDFTYISHILSGRRLAEKTAETADLSTN